MIASPRLCLALPYLASLASLDRFVVLFFYSTSYTFLAILLRSTMIPFFVFQPFPLFFLPPLHLSVALPLGDGWGF